MSESLKGKVAVVTGAASGIGLATTKLLIEADVKVFMVDWDEKTVREKSKDLGENAIPQITNLLDVESCAAMIPEILEKTDKIDILHCNAGTYIGGNLDETDGPTIDRMLNLNINAVMKNVHSIIPHMKQRGIGRYRHYMFSCRTCSNSMGTSVFRFKVGYDLFCSNDATPTHGKWNSGQSSFSRPSCFCSSG